MPVTALHLGALHPVEQVLTLLLAFGPFVVLGIVIARRRRADEAAEVAEAAEAAEAAAEAPRSDQRDR